jgi:hypothetical protein
MKFILIFMVFIFHHSAFSHSGGTDTNGCHAGSKPYHCHNDGDGNIYNPYIREEPNDSEIIGRWKEDNTTTAKKAEEDGYGIWAWVVVGIVIFGICGNIAKAFGWLEYLLTRNTSVKEADYFTSTSIFLSLLTLGGLALYFLE